MSHPSESSDGKSSRPRTGSTAGKSPALAPIKALAPLPNVSLNAAADSSDQPSSSPSSSSAPAPLPDPEVDPEKYALARGEHLLHQRWSFWFDVADGSKPPNPKDWGASLRKMLDFVSIEGFWGTINNIARPSTLPMRSDYHCFRAGVKPAWEDPQNRQGGKWQWELHKRDDNEMDRAWLITLLCMIGEQFSDADQVMGCVVSLRKGRNRLALWTRSDSQHAAIRVGQEWKKMIGVPHAHKIQFFSHSQALNKKQYDQTPQYTL